MKLKKKMHNQMMIIEVIRLTQFITLFFINFIKIYRNEFSKFSQVS